MFSYLYGMLRGRVLLYSGLNGNIASEPTNWAWSYPGTNNISKSWEKSDRVKITCI